MNQTALSEINKQLALLTTPDEIRAVWSLVKIRAERIERDGVASFVIGEHVSFSAHGVPTKGIVTAINRKTVSVRANDGRGWRVAPGLLTKLGAGISGEAPAPRRADTEIIKEIVACYVGLSPENLTCDGEASRAAISRRGAALRRQLQTLFMEFGRKVDESEAYALLERQSAGVSK